MKFLKVETPQVAQSVILAHLEKAFGLEGSLKGLEGERDQNFRLTEANGQQWVVKVTNREEPPEIIDCQIKAMVHVALADPTLLTPRVRSTRQGSQTGELHDADGLSYQTQVLSYLPGEIVGEQRLTVGQLEQIGETVARLARALRGFSHPAAIDRGLLWDNREAPRLLPHVNLFAKAEDQALAREVLEDFRDRCLAPLRLLRAQVIHGDAHPFNVLIGENGGCAGIIDFGDTLHGPLIQDLANVAADFLRLDQEPSETLGALLRGYRRITPLEEEELALFLPCVEIRLLQTPLINAIRQDNGTQPQNYLDSFSVRCLPLIRRLRGSERPQFEAAVRRAAAFAPPLPEVKLPDLLARRFRVMSERMYLFYDPPLHMVKGEGVWLTDETRRRFLDCYNNVPHVGHCHPYVAEAIARQARQLNTNTRYVTDQSIAYAERLVATTFPSLSAVAYVNSGSEANDVAWRMAKVWTGHRGALVMDYAYHGITDAIDAFSPANDPQGRLQPHMRTLPPPDRYRGPFTGEDAAARYAALADQPIASLQQAGLGTAAFMLDSAFMTNGILAPLAGYVQGVVQRVRAAGGLFIADEVQSGFGRMGQFFWGHQHHGLEPDFITIGKPAGNGHPLGVVITRPEIMDRFMQEAAFFSTFGGNNVSCAAGLAVMDVIRDEGLVKRATGTGDLFRAGLRGLMPKHNVIGDVRGIGLAIGLELVLDRHSKAPAKAETTRLISLIRDEGVLVGSEGILGNVIKIRPPLAFQPDHVAIAVAAIDRALARL